MLHPYVVRCLLLFWGITTGVLCAQEVPDALSSGRPDQQDMMAGGTEWPFWPVVSLALGIVTTLACFALVRFRHARNHALTRFRDSELRYRQIVESANDIIYRADPSGHFTYVNPTAMRLTGFSEEKDLLGTHFSRLVRPDHRQSTMAFYRKQFEHRIPSTYLEFPVLDGQGGFLWIGQNVQMVQFEGRVHEFTAVARDITGWKDTEIELRESEFKYRNLVDTMNEGLVVVNNDDVVLFANQRFCEMMGFEQLEILGKRSTDLLSVPLEARTTVRQKQLSRLEGERERYELSIQRKDGARLHVRVSASNMYDRTDQVVGALGVITDITAIKQAREQVRESESRFRNLFERSPDPMFVESLTGKVLHVNQAACDLHRKSYDELVGQVVFDLIPESQREQQQANFRKLASGTLEYLESTSQVGEERIIDVGIKASRIEYSGEQALLLQVRDISARKAAEAALWEAKEKAEASTRAKDLFLANMSHEIRTPINGVMGMTHLLNQTQLNPEQQEYLNAVEFSSQHLLTVINDILDFSKIGSGKLELETVQFNLHRLIDNLRAATDYRAREKKLALVTDWDDAVPEMVLGDPHRLQQILVNLLENGIKFTEEGEIRLSVRKAHAADGNVTIAFAVSDTGIGIPAEKQAAIFEHFTQAESGTERQYGGTGLGLAICDHLVALQGGSLSLESEVGKGSVFRFSLTYQVVSQQLEPVASETHDAVHESDILSGLRVLVADDNAISRLFMGRLLKTWGCTIAMCHHGKEVVNTLKSQEFDLVLMDVQMPQLDGYSATRVIREDLGISADDLPILAITANAMKGERDRCQQAGMNDYLSKPFEPADLHRKLLAICPAPQSGVRSPKVVPHNDVDVNGGKSRKLDLQYLIKAAGGDRSFVLEIIRTFLENHPAAMQELADFIEARKWREARSSAHAIAPTFRYIGEARGADLTGQLEEMAFQEVDERQEEMVAIMVELRTISLRTLELLRAEEQRLSAGAPLIISPHNAKHA